MKMRRIEVTYDTGLFKAYPGVMADTIFEGEVHGIPILVFDFIGSDRTNNEVHRAKINMNHVLFIEKSDEEDMKE